MSGTRQITRAEIESSRYTARQLRRWGVPWPPPKGWRKALLAGAPIPAPVVVGAPADPRQPDLFAQHKDKDGPAIANRAACL